MSIVSDQQIVRLQISMDDSSFVQVLECQDNVCGVETNITTWQTANRAKKREAITTRHVLENQIEMGVILKRVKQFDYKVGRSLRQDFTFSSNMRDVLACGNILLLENLDGIEVTWPTKRKYQDINMDTRTCRQAERSIPVVRF